VSGSVDGLGEGLNMVDRLLRRIKTRHVNRSSDKEAVRKIVRRYFAYHRVGIAAVLGNEDQLVSLDQAMQDLLRCTHRRTPTDQYRKVLALCRENLNQLEVEAVAPRTREGPAAFDRQEQSVLDTLRKVSPSAAICYEQGLIDLSNSGRLSWRGTILEFREALREVLDHLAPDREVMAVQGFQLEAGTKGPTMRQKTLFILKSRGSKGSQAEPAQKATQAVEEIVGRLVRSVYDRASTGVHTKVGIVEARQVKNWVTTVLLELLEVSK
jgi:hypothetical protein